MKAIIEKARRISIPTGREEQKNGKTAELLLGLVRKAASGHPQVVGVEMGGSYAKGTWLKDRMDFDIFVKIRTDVDERGFEEIGRRIGIESMKGFKPRLRYSEHPYVEAEIGGVKVNVVPSYDVGMGQWRSAADRSSFHTRFILERLDDSKKNEVRLLKKFLKGVGIYGAEIAREGFGGYVAEVLVYNFGSFLGVLEAAANFTPGHVIGSPAKKFDTPLVLVDPVDSNRNLGTAISARNVARFILASRAFLKRPSLVFFTGRSRTPGRKIMRNVLVVKFRYKWRSPDIVWGQAKRAATALAGQLELGGFEVVRRGAVTDEESEAALIFLLRNPSIGSFAVKTGPDVYRRSDAENFVLKNSGNIMTWVGDDGRILSMQEREFCHAGRLLEHLLRRRPAQSGVPSGLIPDIRRGFKVVRGDAPASKSIKKALAEITSTDGLLFSSGK